MAVNWKDESIKFLVYRISPSLILLFISLIIWPALNNKFQLIDTTLLIVCSIVFTGCILYDFKDYKKNEYYLTAIFYYSLSAVLFLLLCTFLSQELIRLQIPLLAFVTAFILFKILHLTKIQVEYIEKNKLRKNTGFAATGILINRNNPHGPTFILVLNKNLKNKQGLWVPPGGHYLPHFENPSKKLTEKIQSEIGVKTSILNPYKYNFPDNINDYKTDLVTWMDAPVFLLEENLMGKCSHDHEYHIDSIFLCITDFEVVEKRPKYDYKDRIEIPVSACIENYDTAEQGIKKAIEKWHIDNNKQKPAITDNLTKDVIWRLHLAAKIYTSLLTQTQ